ncbi:MAG: glutamate racemase [Myxococcota bacterium]|nr:glutamate racemase [Myxococcota bacterium]
MTGKIAASDSAIGIFDSGLGGLTVASAIAKRLPHENIVYLGDTARVPYGTRSPATVVRYARKNVSFLKQQGIKMVVVACNTVSAQGLGGLADGSLLPFLGVIRPGAALALESSLGGDIAVLGTRATIRSNAYELAIHEVQPARRVHQIACPLFVPLIEEGWLDHDVTRQIAKTYLAPLAESNVDTVVLGCTHYPLLATILREVLDDVIGPRVQLIDSATAVARSTETLLSEHGLERLGGAGFRRFYVTDAPDRVASVAGQFWSDDGLAPVELEHIDLLDH